MAVVRKERWETMLSARKDESGGGKGGWAEGLAEKVLEVRTPRWRSEAVSPAISLLGLIGRQGSWARKLILPC